MNKERMESSEAANQLLKTKYDLHKSPEADAAAQKTRRLTGEKVPQDPLARIQNYLDRLQNVFDPPKLKGHPNFDRQERNLSMLKPALYDRFVTKLEDIPESYWKSQERILRERGQQGDYDRFSEDDRLKWKRELSNGLLDDQRASLEQWIDYLTSPDSAYMPSGMKYWVFRSITDLQEYDKEKQDFPKRSKGTVKQFPDINPEALAYVTDAVIKKQKGGTFTFDQFEFDLTAEEKEKFKASLNQENFAKLYAWANEQIAPISQHLLPVTEGSWIKYDQNSDYRILANSIRGRGTGWCTAGENTAQSQLQAGDFYVFYSNDDEGKPTIPRIAIRREAERIAEVRGIAAKQNLDPYMGDVLAKKLEEFPDKDQYLKKEADMKLLTEVENKMKAGQALTSQELAFLYEVDSPIEGFGYSKDPRIGEIRSHRNLAEDMPIVFGCETRQIARDPSQIKPDTKAYIGPLEPGIFDQISKFNIEHIYTKFPEGRIRQEAVEIGGKSAQQLETELKKAGVQINHFAQEMMNNKDFTTLPTPQLLNTVRLTVQDLGFNRGTLTTDEIYKKAAELGLDLCPAEVGPHKRLKDKNQPDGDWEYIAMKQIADSRGDPRVFGLVRRGDELWLADRWARPAHRWGLDGQFVFSLRKSSEPQNTQALGLLDRLFRR